MIGRPVMDDSVSSDGNVNNVRRYYELVDSGDAEGLVALFAQDAEYRRPGYPPLVGHAALLRFYQEERIIEEGRHNVNTLVAQDSQVAVAGEFAGMLKGGRAAELRFADFFTFTADGLFATRETFFFTPLV